MVANFIDQRLQQPADLANPIGHCRAVEIATVTGTRISLGLAVQRKVVGVLRDKDMSEERRAGLAAWDRQRPTGE
jgi:hypothetical protein